MYPWLRRPGLVALLVGLATFGGLFLVGWLASFEHLLIDWTNFRANAGLLFFGSFSQLVLAAAVWYQLRYAADALVTEQRAVADAATERKADLGRSRRERRADAIVEVVASASNSSALYMSSLRSLRNVVATSGSPGTVDEARAELAVAEAARQQAHAARFRVAAMCGLESAEYLAVHALVKVVDRQRAAGDAVVRWGLNPGRQAPGPDPKRVTLILETERDTCLGLASSSIKLDDDPPARASSEARPSSG